MGGEAKLKKKVVYRHRGHTYHVDPSCVRGGHEELTLGQAISWKWRACHRCALLPLLAEARNTGNPTYLWAYTWPVDEDSESWQQSEKKRTAEAELLVRAAALLGAKYSRSADQLEAELWGSAPEIACALLAAAFPAIGGPSNGTVPSDETLEVFKTLYRDDDAPHRLDEESIQRRDDLWEIAASITG